MKVYVTWRRKVVTLRGPRDVRIKVLCCSEHDPPVMVYPEAMHRLFLPGCNFNVKVMIAVGLLRWALCLQREEIQILLRGRGVEISTGEVSYLSEKFLAYFYLLHRSKYPEMAKLFESRGGAVLHIDGTEEKGSRVVFCAKEGRTGITVMADTIPSEAAEPVADFLSRYKEEFGPPLVVVRDMSQILEKSVTEVFSGVPHQICHFHFVRNLGEKVLGESYPLLRKAVIKSKMVPSLVALRKNLREGGRSKVETAELFWIHLAIDYLEYARKRPSKFPFDLGYFELIQRAAEVHQMAKRLMSWNSFHNIFVQELMAMDAHIKRALEDEEVERHARVVKNVSGWFEKIRKVLRLSRKPLKGGEPMGAKDLDAVERRLKKTLDKIDGEARIIGGNYPKIASDIRKEFALHMHELFVHVQDNKGRDVSFSRDNNALERSHRWSRMHCRRRTGKGLTRRDMDAHGALTAIFSNIFNEVYINDVLGDVDDLSTAFLQIDYEEVKGLLKSLRGLRRGPFLPVKDSDRGRLLKGLVDILTECDALQNSKLDEWIAGLA